MSERAPLGDVPAIVVRFELEAAPTVRAVWLHEGDRDRLFDWLRQKPELEALIARAVELELEERAA
jgi:hypothetical protein